MSDNLTFYEKNHEDRTITFTDSAGDPIDITGYTIFFTIKADMDDSDTDALLKKDITTHTTPASGVTTLSLTDEELDISPGTYDYDIKWKDTNDKLKTILVAKAVILPAVTDRSS